MQNKIINIIRKSLNNTANEEEQEALKQWLYNSEENTKAYEQFQKIWDTFKAIDAKSKLLEPDLTEAWKKVYHAVTSEPKKKKRFSLARIAATLTILLLASSLAYYLLLPVKNHCLEVAVGTVDSVQFEDGSIAYLRGPSNLSYPESFDKKDRTISMQGNILFKVNKDAKRPFIVNSTKGSVTVLGTAFVVNTLEAEAFSVHCITGKVKVLAKDGTSSYETLLTANEKTIYKQGTGSLNKEPFDGKIFFNFGKSGLQFKKILMGKILKEVEKYYAIDISVENEDILSCTYTSSFKNLSSDEVMEELALAFQCKLVKEDNTKYKLLGGQCN